MKNEKKAPIRIFQVLTTSADGQEVPTTVEAQSVFKDEDGSLIFLKADGLAENGEEEYLPCAIFAGGTWQRVLRLDVDKALFEGNDGGAS